MQLGLRPFAIGLLIKSERGVILNKTQNDIPQMISLFPQGTTPGFKGKGSCNELNGPRKEPGY